MMKKGRVVAISYVLGMVGTLMTALFSPVEAMEYTVTKAEIHSAVTSNDREATVRFDEGTTREM